MGVDPKDPRWGGYIPWFLLHPDFPAAGDFPTFFSRLSQRLERLFRFNECNVNLTHFGPWLETESLQRFRDNPKNVLNGNIEQYFDSKTLETEAKRQANTDQEESEAFDAEASVRAAVRFEYSLGMGVSSLGSNKAPTEEELRELDLSAQKLRAIADNTRDQRKAAHYRELVIERLGALAALLRILPSESSWKALLIQDIRRFFAESNIMLDIDTQNSPTPQIIPLEEPLLQQEVLDRLLPRLSTKFPDRAKELIRAYHDFLQGMDGDTVFLEAFKTLEEIARSITGNQSFEFDKDHLDKHFPKLHGTIHQTLIRLAGHRGDKGGHGKVSPPPHEIRYLLFAICNAALLLLDYPPKSGET